MPPSYAGRMHDASDRYRSHRHPLAPLSELNHLGLVPGDPLQLPDSLVHNDEVDAPNRCHDDKEEMQ